MDFLKKIITFFVLLVFTITGVPVSSIASEGDEEAGAFEDPNEETEEATEEAAAAAAGGATAGGATAGGATSGGGASNLP